MDMEANEMIVSMENESTANSSMLCFYPKVNDEFKPFIGQEFQTIDAVDHFYNTYAAQGGFEVRVYSSKKSRDGREVKRKEYVCNKEGNYTKELSGDEKRRRGVVREGCKARLVVNISKSGGFVVTKFEEGHCHNMTTPRKRHLLRSHRRLSSTQKSLTAQLDIVNISPHQQFDILGVQAGGFENIGFTQQDIYNYRRDRRNEMKGHDGVMLHDHFLLEKERNSGFTFKIESDNERKITRCFWADASARQSYQFYGDVLIFDTTYNTNRYCMIFAPMMAVNNHGKTIMLSGALLSDETTDSFVWLFKEFFKAMPGDVPKMIITDQDPAITKAISEVLPHTFHRFCSWHILTKFSEKLDAIKLRDHHQSFKTCVWSSESRDEFDSRWRNVVERSGFSGNAWLESIFQLRFKWVPAYVNHIFSAEMSSSQRAESGHSFLKRYVNKNNSLVDFMIQYNRGILRQRQKELIADHIDIYEKPRFKCPIKMEKQMASIYTRTYFYKFQDQLWDSYSYNIVLTGEDVTHCMYKVVHMGDEKGRVRDITYDKSKDFASCSCHMFESGGIPCSHLLSYLHKVRQLHTLPDQYILKRWTRAAKLGHVIDNSGVEIIVEKSLLERRGTLFQRYSHVIDKVVVSDEASQLFCEAMDSLIERITQLLDSSSSSNTSSVGDVLPLARISDACEASFNEPNPVKAKGSGKRLKRGKEKAKGNKNDKGRRCNGCGKYGQSHDKRNCPMLQNRSSTSEKDAIPNSDYLDSDSSGSEDELHDADVVAAFVDS